MSYKHTCNYGTIVSVRVVVVLVLPVGMGWWSWRRRVGAITLHPVAPFLVGRQGWHNLDTGMAWVVVQVVLLLLV